MLIIHEVKLISKTIRKQAEKEGFPINRMLPSESQIPLQKDLLGDLHYANFPPEFGEYFLFRSRAFFVQTFSITLLNKKKKQTNAI